MKLFFNQHTNNLGAKGYFAKFSTSTGDLFLLLLKKLPHLKLNSITSVLFLLLVIISGCKERELPEEIIGEPTFYIEGEIDGREIDLAAGLNEYYMATEYFQDEFEVYTFSGTLSPIECPKCPESLQVQIRDFRTRELGTSVDIDSAIEIGEYGYYHDKGGNEYVFRVNFLNQSSTGGNTTYSWDFGDGSGFEGNNPTHDYTDTTQISTQVCLESIDPSGCTTTICNQINFKTRDCAVDFTHQLDPSVSYVSFFANVKGKEPFDFRWDFGDGFSATLGNPGYFYGNPGLYTVCLTVTDANGCESSICKNIAADPTYCENNFTYEIQKTTTPDPLQLSTITVNWRDESGKFYTSASEIQPETSQFEILEVLPYKKNENGEETLRLKVKFNCELYHNGEIIQLKDAIGYIGVAYP